MSQTKIASALFLVLFFSHSSTASDADDFVGTWLLVHIQERNESGDWVIPNSTVGTSGYINYSTNGYMSFQSQRPGGLDFTNNSFADSTAEELKRVLMNYGAYFGTYEINEKSKTVTHYIIENIDRSRAGISTSRVYSFDEQQLTLTTGGRIRYVWRKP